MLAACQPALPPAAQNDFQQATQHTADVRRRKAAKAVALGQPCAHFKAYKPNVAYKDLRVAVNEVALPKCP